MKGMMKRPKTMEGNRSDRLLREYDHDTYRSAMKLEGALLCPECHAVYSEGRWQWVHNLRELKKFLNKTHKKDHETCPACKRVTDHFPAGELVLRGDFLFSHMDEIIGLTRNEELSEMGRHPLNRIMEIRRKKEEVVIETTDQHLPSRIAKALKRAYGGMTNIKFAKASGMMRVVWAR